MHHIEKMVKNILKILWSSCMKGLKTTKIIRKMIKNTRRELLLLKASWGNIKPSNEQINVP